MSAFLGGGRFLPLDQQPPDNPTAHGAAVVILDCRMRKYRCGGSWVFSFRHPVDGRHVIILQKGGEQAVERYTFYFNQQTHEAFTQKIGHMAANPDLSLDWREAAVICQAARDQVNSETQ
jgi:hypothetical protein